MSKVTDPKLVVLKKFNTLHEANIVKSFLDSRGIETFVFDEHTANLYATPAAFFGIRVMINKDLVNQANEALRDQEEQLKQEGLPVQGITCPNCSSQSTEIKNLDRKDIFWFLASFFFLIPMTRASKELWLCISCNHEWSVKINEGVFAPLIIIIRLILVIFIGFYLYKYFGHLIPL